MFLFTADHGTRRGHSDRRRYVESSVITSFYIHFTLHCQHNMTIFGLSLHHWNTETLKNLEQKFFELGTLYPHGISERLSFHQFIHKFMSLYFHQWQSSSTLPYKPGRRENFFSLPKPGGKYNLSSKFVKSKGKKENCLLIKANQVSTKERTRRPGGIL